MEKKGLISVLSEVFVPIGFKKKGNYWVLNGDEITKIVNLQKSQFSKSFYVNYGYILKSIPLVDMMHIFNRFSSEDKDERQRITELLDLENNISDEERANELDNLLNEKIVSDIKNVNSEKDILTELGKRAHLNNVPLVVKMHFGLEKMESPDMLKKHPEFRGIK